MIHEKFIKVARIDFESEEIFDCKVMKKIKQLQANGIQKVSFSQIASDEILKIAEDIKDWDITDKELFEDF